MAIMAESQRHDARGTARLLAAAARDSINNPDIAATREAELSNIYRLLETYRVDPHFDQTTTTSRPSPQSPSLPSLRPSALRHVSDVRAALDGAMTGVFADQPPEQAIGLIVAVLKNVVYPAKNQDRPSKEDCMKAAPFFDKMLDGLRVTVAA